MHTAAKPLHKSPVSGWKVIGGSEYRAPKGKDFPLHHHSCWEFVYYRTGSPVFRHGNELIQMQPGDLCLTPPGVPHEEIAHTAYSNYFLLMEGPTNTLSHEVIHENSDKMSGLLCRLLLASSQQRDDSMMECLTTALMLHVWKNVRAGRCSKATLVIDTAQKEWARNPAIPIDAMAKKVGLSVSAFRQYAQQVEGCSPMELRLRIKIQRAVSLLRTSTLKLDAIAELSGFNSASHLSRHIKVYTGKAPGALRNGCD